MCFEGVLLLSALVVDWHRCFGGGCGGAVARREGARPDGLELHAATKRLACHRESGAASLPPSGGATQLHPQVVAAPARVQRAAAAMAPAPVCFERLPRTGVSDDH